MSIVFFSLALCLFVSVIPLCTYIVYSAGTKVELHTWNNDKVICHVFFILSSFERICIINERKIVLNY